MPKTNDAARAAFIARKAEVDAALEDYAALLKRITDSNYAEARASRDKLTKDPLSSTSFRTRTLALHVPERLGSVPPCRGSSPHERLSHPPNHPPRTASPRNRPSPAAPLSPRRAFFSPSISIAGVTIRVRTVAITKPPAMAELSSVHHWVEGAP